VKPDLDSLADSLPPSRALARIKPDDLHHPRLALDHGLAVHRASLQWTGHAIDALRAAHAYFFVGICPELLSVPGLLTSGL